MGTVLEEWIPDAIAGDEHGADGAPFVCEHLLPRQLTLTILCEPSSKEEVAPPSCCSSIRRGQHATNSAGSDLTSPSR